MMSEGGLFAGSESAPGVPAALWLDGGQGGLASGIARHGNLSYVGVGGEAGRDDVVGVRAIGDLRSAIADSGAGLAVRCVVVLSKSGIGSQELGALAAAQSRRVVVCGLEPAPARLDELIDGTWLGRPGTARAIERYHPLARLRTGAAMRQARDTLASFGPIRTAWVRCEGIPAHGSLGARLVDGLDVLHDLMGEPESVVAIASGGEPGDDLSALTGELSVTLMYGDGRSASVLATSRAARWRREVDVLGEAGAVSLGDDGFAWQGVDGEVRDEWSRASAEDVAARVMGESVARLLDPHAASEGVFDAEGVLATAHAALLSARTRSVELVGAIRRMMTG